MKLTLSDGKIFEGKSFGAEASVSGEVVFHTGMSGYVETLTDPSYHGQILVLTYPLQGNYGVPPPPFESKQIQVQGLVVTKYTAGHSHVESEQTLSAWLKSEGVPAIEAVDTRTLTRHLREQGTLEGTLAEGPNRPAAIDMSTVTRKVVPDEVTRYPGNGPSILLIDMGSKKSIVNSLTSRGASVIRVPYFGDWESYLDQVDGVVLSSGPGDPTHLTSLVKRVRPLFQTQLTVFGICLGHQIMALAAGAETYKLKYGHRSLNQPVMDISTKRSFVTSQNHGYVVQTETLPADWKESFVNLNDRTNEGLAHVSGLYTSVQFHPEASAGPRDTSFLFENFLTQTAQLAKEIRFEKS